LGAPLWKPRDFGKTGRIEGTNCETRSNLHVLKKSFSPIHKGFYIFENVQKLNLLKFKNPLKIKLIDK